MIDHFPLGELTAETFLKEYWQKKPLLIRNAFPDFQPPVDADELAGLACEDVVESRLILQDAEGEEWNIKHGPFDENSFAELPDSHWTLLVQAVDHWVPEANELLERFRFIPQWRIDDLMISYATKGGGVGPHYDNYDVFLIQAAGQRCWEVGGLFGEDSPRRPDTPVMILPEWEAEERYVLEPGDMLYLPPRVGHNGWAESDGCMTYSVGFRAPSHADILRQFTDYVGDQLKSEIRYEDPQLQIQKHSGEITQEATDKVRRILLDYINEPELLENWFGQFMTEPKYPENETESSETLAPEQLEAYLKNDGILYRSEGVRFAYRYADDHSLTLFVNGEACSVSKESEAFVITLVENSAISIDDHINQESLEILCELLQMGALYSEE